LDKATTSGFYTYWPNIIALTLTPKAQPSTTADTFASGVSCPTCRKLDPTREQLFAANIIAVDEACVFELWDRGQAAFPLPGDHITDPDGFSWIVKSVEKAIFDNLYIALCVKVV